MANRDNEAILAAGARAIDFLRTTLTEMIQAKASAPTISRLSSVINDLEHLSCDMEDRCIHTEKVLYPPEVEELYQQAMAAQRELVQKLLEIPGIPHSMYLIDFVKGLASYEYDVRFGTEREAEAKSHIKVDGKETGIAMEVKGEFPPGIDPHELKKVVLRYIRQSVREQGGEVVSEEHNTQTMRVGPSRGGRDL